jgi:hypothetical protein
MAVILNEKVARYEDSHQVHSVNVVNWTLKTMMKKLDHNLFVVIEGPDEAKARSCFNQALQAGLIAGAAAAFVGAGVGAAEIGFGVAKASMLVCLGDGFDVRLRDESNWVYWDL